MTSWIAAKNQKHRQECCGCSPLYMITTAIISTRIIMELAPLWLIAAIFISLNAVTVNSIETVFLQIAFLWHKFLCRFHCNFHFPHTRHTILCSLHVAFKWNHLHACNHFPTFLDVLCFFLLFFHVDRRNRFDVSCTWQGYKYLFRYYANSITLLTRDKKSIMQWENQTTQVANPTLRDVDSQRAELTMNSRSAGERWAQQWTHLWSGGVRKSSHSDEQNIKVQKFCGLRDFWTFQGNPENFFPRLNFRSPPKYLTMWKGIKM